MLVLSRRPSEEIVIGENICITVVSVKGDRVRLGITAPWSVSVDRQETRQRRLEFVGEFDEPRGTANSSDQGFLNLATSPANLQRGLQDSQRTAKR